jgi:hypothetical protein
MPVVPLPGVSYVSQGEEEPTVVSTQAPAVLARLLPDATTLRFEACQADGTAAQLTLLMTSTQTGVCCPLCAVPTQHRHSRYARTLVAPWARGR